MSGPPLRAPVHAALGYGIEDLLPRRCCWKAAASYNVGTDSDDALTRDDHFGMGNMPRRQARPVFDRQTPH